MNRKSILGLVLFGCLITAGLFVGVDYMISHGTKVGTDQYQSNTTEDNLAEGNTTGQDSSGDSNLESPLNDKTYMTDTEPWLASNPSDLGLNQNQGIGAADNPADSNVVTEAGTGKASCDKSNSESSNAGEDADTDDKSDTVDTTDAIGGTIRIASDIQLIFDSNEVNYKAFIPKLVYDSELKSALNISNPKISVDASYAILLDADTKKVLYYKAAVESTFSASTVKLLTSLVALDWCKIEEEVTVGDEITMIAPDSTRAYLRKGQVLTLKNLLEGMLLPSGNDAAYATAAYVGRKSLRNQSATKEEAIKEFARLMNQKAKELGVKNSCFKTPDGYDAIGQYTTAYDMGMIGIAAAKNESILAVSKKSSARNIFVSGEDVTWNNTNKLISKYSGEYYSCAIGLKTGTSTMAGRCLIAAARKDGKKVVCVIMDSSAAGRWEDAITLLKYGLK